MRKLATIILLVAVSTICHAQLKVIPEGKFICKTKFETSLYMNADSTYYLKMTTDNRYVDRQKYVLGKGYRSAKQTLYDLRAFIWVHKPMEYVTTDSRGEGGKCKLMRGSSQKIRIEWEFAAGYSWISLKEVQYLLDNIR